MFYTVLPCIFSITSWFLQHLQYCIGTWNVRSMNQGKLEMVKQERERVNIDILAISELKWTWMGRFNTDDHYIHYCGQESLTRNGVVLIVNKSPKCSTLVQSQKQQNDLCSFPRKIIKYHSNSSFCPNQYILKLKGSMKTYNIF